MNTSTLASASPMASPEASPARPRADAPVLSYASGAAGWRVPRLGFLVGAAIAGFVLVGLFHHYFMDCGCPPARQSSLVTMIQSMRSQIALFKLQHDERLPGVFPLVRSGGPSEADAAMLWAQMTQFTDPDGRPSPTKTETCVFGPYFRSTPVNPMNGSTTIASKPARGVGFVYDFAGGAGTGKIWGVDESGALVSQ
jgi:hypothetical protein